MKRIGIVTAMASELQALTPTEVPKGEIATISPELIAVVSGVGAERASDAARRLVSAGATALVSWGCAAALVPDLRVGALVLPGCVIGADGTHPVDAKWHETLCECLAAFPPNTGSLAETTDVLEGEADKIELAAASGATAADMESAAIAAVARNTGIPFVAIRAVSDAVHFGVPAELADAVDEHGEVARTRALMRLAAAPSLWGVAVRLGIGSRSALLTLRRVSQTLFPVQIWDLTRVPQ